MKKHVLLQHDNACLHAAVLTLGKTEKFGWEVLIYLSYSLDLASLDLHLFGPSKYHMSGQHYEND
jgi:hypothetical protein